MPDEVGTSYECIDVESLGRWGKKKRPSSVAESKPAEPSVQTSPPANSAPPKAEPPKETVPPQDDAPPPPSEEPLPSMMNDVSNAPSEPAKPKVSPVLRPSTSDKPKETPSIFGKKKAKEETSESAPVKEKRAKEYSDEDLQNAWKGFADQKTNAGDTDRLVLSKEVKKGDNHSVIIMLGSQLEVSFLEKFDTELVQYLRNTLENDHVVIRTEIAEIKEEKKLYTSTDIFDYMVKQNPDLKDLKDRLGLDFDY